MNVAKVSRRMKAQMGLSRFSALLQNGSGESTSLVWRVEKVCFPLIIDLHGSRHVADVVRRIATRTFAIREGPSRLLMARPHVPSSSAFEELKNFTQLPVEFQLVTRRNYEELRELL